MASEWSLVTIDSLKADNHGAIAIGPFGSRMKSDCYVEKGIPVIRGTNITGSNTFDGDFVYITKEKADTLGSSNVYLHDLVFPHRGSIGEVGIVQDNKRYVLSSSLMKLTCNKKVVNPKFLYYFFKSGQGKHELLKNSSQVGTPGIGQPLTSLKSIELKLPPLKTQEQIADVLTSLDNKIELNRQMNATLEAMAQALFKSWFVDFDPVMDNALAAGNPIPDELEAKAAARQALGDARKPLPEDIRSLFPNAFVFTEEMGWIPEGWEMQPVYDMANFINGTAFNNAQFTNTEGSLPIIKIAEIKNGVSGQTKYTDSIFDEKYLIKEGDVLLSWSGNPDTSIDTFVWHGEKGWLNQHIFKVSFKSEIDKNFSYYQLKFLRPVFAEIARDKQTTGLGHFTVKDMKRIYVFKPDKNTLKSFNKLTEPLFDKWFQNLLATRQLTQLRDTLLPKLLSGELRIPEAERLVEEIL